MPTDNMSVANRGRMTAPIARNWVSTANARRKMALIYVRDRASTKYATLKFASTGTPKSLTLPANSGNVIGTALNVFEVGSGITAGYQTAYTPKFIQPAQISVTGADAATNAIKKEWIVWNGHEQIAEITGSIVFVKGNNTPTTTVVRLMLYINDKPIGIAANDTLDKDKNAVYGYTRMVGGSLPADTVTLGFKHTLNLNDADTVKLMVDRNQSTGGNHDINIHSASLTVRTLPLY